ncbi:MULTISPECIES: Gfo/Idh/MocA family protein [Streptomyces]|uniref:Gfo/Idh/MocA family oxidoreductase n=1 Tax=Streptomyces dengpaensis TaxID=2049881 RepID=A0ABM6SMN7_9ACTN|nr:MULTISPECIES: Gfo/Idh/MocA family oxidoreductase [Streptomyces]AVH55922.1 gfo/Idh/MocA family oxidoreductase [Streptomyces dengpaensis]PIB12173.1 oxidoreductase [Streptomyces sp. HG99]
MSLGPLGVAIVGAGVISDQYLTNLSTFPDVKVLGIADIDVERARAQAAAYDVPVAGDLDTVLALPEAEIVVNLTVPAAHYDVASAALKAGKHVYGEKPLALDRDEGEKLLAQASDLGLRVGCAPDTFLGAGIQSAARALAAGAIGAPVSAMTAVMNRGPELWHPNPEFFYQPGAGPLFDLGPYYLTTLVALLGPATRVAALSRTGRRERVIGSGPKAGTAFPVDVPTHVTALIDFEDGPSASSTFSFDSALGRILFEITGTEGTLAVPDPNTFGGRLRVRAPGETEWRELPVDGPQSGRGMGVLDMARAIRADGPHRASGELAQHVLELMTAVTDSGERTAFTAVASRCAKPLPMPASWDPAAATLT